LRDGRRDCAGGYGASPPRWEGLARFLPGRRGGCFTCMAYILIMVLAARAREDNEGLQQLSTRPPRRLPRSFRLRRGMAGRRQPGRRRRLGRWGEQLANLLSREERDRVFVLRYWSLGSQPHQMLTASHACSGSTKIRSPRPSRRRPAVRRTDNARPFVEPAIRASVLGRGIAPAPRPEATCRPRSGRRRPGLA
jgi:hypothetical protein